VFFLAVWGELSPPTSLSAAVCARIANASFMRTMWEALKVCLPITLLTFVPFTRSEMVTQPGWKQIGDCLLVATACSGLAFAMFGRCLENWVANALVGLLLALFSLATLFHPNDSLVWATGAITLVVLIWAIRRHSRIASPPKLAPVVETKEGAPPRAEDLASVISEAKRDIG
jgi:TRAP-type uncharacterized transport system fused permease subunit